MPPTSIRATRKRRSPAAAYSRYDPSGCGAPTGTGTGKTCGGQYGAVTDNLVAGNYTLVLNMLNSSELAYVPGVTPVALPGTLPLLAAGLAALACLAPRRRHRR